MMQSIQIKFKNSFFVFGVMDTRKQGGDGGSVLGYVTDGDNDADDVDTHQKQKKPATIYSPTQSPMQYHRRERA